MDEKNKQNGEIKYSKTDEEIKSEILNILNTPEEDDDCITSACKSFVKFHGIDDLIDIFKKPPRNTTIYCPDKGVDFEKLRIVEEDIARNKLAKEQKALEEKQGS